MDQVILQTQKLTKAFGGLIAVNNIDMDFYTGELRAIIGPNGAGKTTYLAMIMGRLKPTSGKILFKGRDITGLPPYKVFRLGISTTFQLTSIFPDLTVYENVWVAAQSRCKGYMNPLIHHRRLKEAESRVERVLKQLNLDSVAAEPAGSISHGEQRVLEIGIALATDPELLLLDEPTSGMSAKEASEMATLIKEIAKEKTVILVEHNMDVVMRIADKITVFDKGKILAEGSPKSISENKKVQEVYLGGA
jgi:branched-chain amino acid transport system ATP-binding protein